MEPNQQITMLEVQAVIGEYELAQRVWKREYAKLAAKVVELEAELEETKGKLARRNGHKAAEPEQESTPAPQRVLLPTNLGQNGHHS